MHIYLESSTLNRTPLAPPGTKVFSHHKTDQWDLWVPQDIEG